MSVSYSTIRSPIDGRTGSLLVHAGNVVKPNDKTLVVIREVQPVYVRFAVPEQYLARVRARMKEGELTVVALPRATAPIPRAACSRSSRTPSTAPPAPSI